MAAPFIPMFRYFISAISRTRLQKTDTARIISAVTVSPQDRSAAAYMLYKNAAGRLIKIQKRYVHVYSFRLSGVCNIFIIIFISESPASPRKIEKIRPDAREVKCCICNIL